MNRPDDQPANGSAGVQDTPAVDRAWQERLARTYEVRAMYAQAREAAGVPLDEDVAREIAASLDARAGVGARHHVVPRFLLERWSDRNGQVLVYHRPEGRHGLRNIKDLAIKDFYTFIDFDNAKNSMVESLLSRIEADGALVIRKLLSSFEGPGAATPADIAVLATFAGFQVVRSPRFRRTQEIQAEWYAKTMAKGRIDEDRLSGLSVVPHQNEFIRTFGELATEFMPMFHARPVALITLDRPLLLIGDDPVVVNPGEREVQHVPDCSLTDGQIAERARRNRRRNRRHPERQARMIHFHSPIPQGIGTALELILPVSPHAALVWGELGERYEGVATSRLEAEEADRFARLVNDWTCARALDWIAARPDDVEFRTRDFPPHGPLMQVCDGENAASKAVNTTPVRIRPHRLTTAN